MGFIIFSLSFVLLSQSCSNTVESQSDSMTFEKDDFAKDLKSLSCFIRNCYYVNQTRSDGTISDSLSAETMTAIQEELSTFLHNYDLTKDLTTDELNNLHISDQLRDSMLIDHHVFQEYVERNKSSDYIQFMKSIVNDHAQIPENEIIENNSLKMNEKVELVMTQNVIEVLPYEEMGYKVAENECEEDYSSAITDCQINYAFEIAVVLISSGPSGGTTLSLGAIATAQYLYCIDSASRDYQKCKERKKQK